MPSSVFDSSVKRTVQRGLSDGERDLLENPPRGYRCTLDGHCALAGPGRAVVYDLDGAGFVYADAAEVGL